MAIGKRRLAIASSALMLVASFASLPARASFEGSGAVAITVVPLGETTPIIRLPENVLASDRINDIAIGLGGPVVSQLSGILWIDDEGPDQIQYGSPLARYIGEVSVTKGELSITNSRTSGAIRVGFSGFQPSTGALRIEASSHSGRIDVGNGSVEILGSKHDAGELLIRSGTLVVEDSSLSDFQLMTTAATATLSRSTILGRGGLLYGNFQLNDCTVTMGLAYTDGSATVMNTAWTSPDVRIGDAGTSGAAPPATSLRLESSTLEVAGDLWVFGPDASVELAGTSSVVSVGDDLSIVGTGARLGVRGTNSVVQVDWLLSVGAASCGPGSAGAKAELTVADGGSVIGRTLVLCPESILNLDAGGTVQVQYLYNYGGTINENGGTLVVPESASVLGGACAFAALAVLRRRRLRR